MKEDTEIDSEAWMKHRGLRTRTRPEITGNSPVLLSKAEKNQFKWQQPENGR